MAYDPNDAADKKIFDDAIAEATEGLKAKNAELLSETKKLKETIRKGEANPQALEQAEARIETLMAERDDAAAKLKDANKSLGKTTKQLESETGYNRNLLIDGGLTDALVAANIAKPLMPAAKALFAGKAEVKIEGDKRSVFIGDKPLGEAITAWSQSDEGKHFVSATKNSGGNGPGGGAAQSKSVSRTAFDAMPQNERTAHFAAGGTISEG